MSAYLPATHSAGRQRRPKMNSGCAGGCWCRSWAEKRETAGDRRNVRAAQEPRESGQLPQGRGADLNTLDGNLGGGVQHLLLHLREPQPCAWQFLEEAPERRHASTGGG